MHLIMNKGEKITMTNTIIIAQGNLPARPYYGNIEYEMSKQLAKSILDTRKGTERNMPPQKFLCQVVNDEFGLKGNCIKVNVI